MQRQAARQHYLYNPEWIPRSVTKPIEKTRRYILLLQVHRILLMEKQQNIVLNVKIHRIIESFKFKKTFKIIKPNHKPNIGKSATRLCP